MRNVHITAFALMWISFAAFADDCTVAGDIDLPSDRLSDFLASTTEFEIDKPAFRALDDGRVVEAASAVVLRDDLCVVIASGPRGRPERRGWTRQHPVRAQVGPYSVLGYLHAAPTVNPLHSVERRPVVALTESVVEYAEADDLVRVHADAIILNCSKVERLETVTADDINLAKAPRADAILEYRPWGRSGET